MIPLAIITWYLVGSVGGAYLKYRRFNCITEEDILFFLTVGGIGGFLTVMAGEWVDPFE